MIVFFLGLVMIVGGAYGIVMLAKSIGPKADWELTHGEYLALAVLGLTMGAGLLVVLLSFLSALRVTS